QCCLTGSPCAPGSLGVVGWSWRNIAKVNSIESRNIHAQFHCWRTEQDRQKRIGLLRQPSFRILTKLLQVVSSISETIFAPLATVLIHLGCVFTSLEPEQPLPTSIEHVGERLIQAPKISVPSDFFSLSRVRYQTNGACFKLPAFDIEARANASNKTKLLGRSH